MIPAAVDTLHWGGYYAVDTVTREVVGSCAFKTAPDEGGRVEIAYFTYPGFEGRGYASAMAFGLIRLAKSSPLVQEVFACTLAQENPSTSVLKKVGMQFEKELVDPEDGRIWRWTLPVRGDSQKSNV